MSDFVSIQNNDSIFLIVPIKEINVLISIPKVRML